MILDANLGGHAAVAADFDGDGDLDLVSKLWRPRKDNANGGSNHVDFLENLTRSLAVISREPSGSPALPLTFAFPKTVLKPALRTEKTRTVFLTARSVPPLPIFFASAYHILS